MLKLYFITGPADIGKSNVSKQLDKRFDKSALIEEDDIYHQVVGGCVPALKDGNHLDVLGKVWI